MDRIPGTEPSAFENQMVYRLASLEATVSNSLRRLDEKIDNFQKDFHHRDTNRAASIAALEARVENNKENFNRGIRESQETCERTIGSFRDEIDLRVKNLEFFRTELLAKAFGISAVVGIIWVLFGDVVKNSIGVG